MPVLITSTDTLILRVEFFYSQCLWEGVKTLFAKVSVKAKHGANAVFTHCLEAYAIDETESLSGSRQDCLDGRLMPQR